MKYNLIAIIVVLMLPSIFLCITEREAIVLQNIEQKLEILELTGKQAERHCDNIAQIRITLFSEYPYLYQGTIACEKEYLRTYFESSNASILLVFDKGDIVGFSSSIPLSQETHELKRPFIEKGLDCNEYLYIGEVMIHPLYRGKGIARYFLEFHENKARQEGYEYTTFMTVDRPDDHPCKPKNFKPVDEIWQHFGYKLLPDMKVSMGWLQVDTETKTLNTLSLWYKKV